MSTSLVWLDEVIHDIRGVQIVHNQARRIRANLPPESLPTLLALLKGRAGYLHLSAISCVDWPQDDTFELVYHVYSYETKVLVSAHIRIAKAVNAFISVYDLYEPAAFFERDIYEMFGLTFEGSPYMEKFILTEWNGPPPMLKSFDTKQYVQDTFDWQDYQPDWLNDIRAKGGRIVE